MKRKEGEIADKLLFPLTENGKVERLWMDADAVQHQAGFCIAWLFCYSHATLQEVA
jgi:hypothetical protein